MSAARQVALPEAMSHVRGFSSTRAARTIRALVWLLLGALVVRTIGAGVGTWAGGRLGLLPTILIGAVWPAWFLVFFPTWLAWRVLRPMGLRRAVKACLWLSPLASWRDLPSIESFLEVLAGRPLPVTEGRKADAWIALAAALEAEQQHNRVRADRILEALTHLPDGSRIPLLARGYGVESLAWTALLRKDWRRLLRYARLGQGRLIHFLSTLAAAELGQPIRPIWLLLQWALAPKRLATAGLVGQAIARQRTPSPSIPPPVQTGHAPHETAALPDPRLRHLLLLGARREASRSRCTMCSRWPTLGTHSSMPPPWRDFMRARSRWMPGTAAGR